MSPWDTFCFSKKRKLYSWHVDLFDDILHILGIFDQPSSAERSFTNLLNFRVIRPSHVKKTKIQQYKLDISDSSKKQNQANSLFLN